MNKTAALLVLPGVLLTAGWIFFGCASQNPSYNDTTTTTLQLPTGPTASVNIASFAFSPAAITISQETTVIWTNNDPTTHTVTSTAGPVSFNSGAIASGGTYSLKFSTTGSYTYKCSIHPSMTGSVTIN
jgi:plastocyanin